MKQSFQRKTMSPQPQIEAAIGILIFIVSQLTIKAEIHQVQFWSKFEITNQQSAMGTLNIRPRSSKSN